MMTSPIPLSAPCRVSVDMALAQKVSGESLLLSVREYAALLPKLSDVVLATTQNEQDAIYETINECEKGVASIENCCKVAATTPSSDKEADHLLSEIAHVKNKVEYLRSRAQEVSGRSLESIANIRPLPHHEQLEIAMCLKEKRADFWAKLYQVPFIQESIIEGLSRIVAGENRARAVIFASPSDVSNESTALQEAKLLERAQVGLERVTTILQDPLLPKRRAEISLLLQKTPIKPEKSLVLCAEFRRMAAELAECEGQLLCDYKTIEDAQKSEDARVQRWQALRDACGGTALQTHYFLQELTRLQEPYQRLKDYFVISNLGLVGAWNQGTYQGRIDSQDLFQQGVLGLMKGVERFDPLLGFNFSTLSVSHIRSEIQNERDASRYAVKVSPKAKEALRSVANNQLTEVRGCSLESIQSSAGVSQDEALAILPLMRPTQSFNAPVGSTKEGSLVDLHGDPRAVLPSHAAHQEDVRAAVQQALSTLSPEHQEIISRHFGLAPYQRMTDAEIGEIFGRSTENIRQKRAQALHLLQRSKHSVALKKLTSDD